MTWLFRTVYGDRILPHPDSTKELWKRSSKNAVFSEICSEMSAGGNLHV